MPDTPEAIAEAQRRWVASQRVKILQTQQQGPPPIIDPAIGRVVPPGNNGSYSIVDGPGGSDQTPYQKRVAWDLESGPSNSIGNIYDADTDDEGDVDMDRISAPPTNDNDPRILLGLGPMQPNESLLEFRMRVRNKVNRFGFVWKDTFGAFAETNIDPAQANQYWQGQQSELQRRQYAERAHANKLDLKNPFFDAAYAAAWQLAKEERKNRNEAARNWLLNDLRDWGEICGQPRMPTPEPEAEGDELFAEDIERQPLRGILGSLMGNFQPINPPNQTQDGEGPDRPFQAQYGGVTGDYGYGMPGDPGAHMGVNGRDKGKGLAQGPPPPPPPPGPPDTNRWDGRVTSEPTPGFNRRCGRCKRVKRSCSLANDLRMPCELCYSTNQRCDLDGEVKIVARRGTGTQQRPSRVKGSNCSRRSASPASEKNPHRPSPSIVDALEVAGSESRPTTFRRKRHTDRGRRRRGARPTPSRGEPPSQNANNRPPGRTPGPNGGGVVPQYAGTPCKQCLDPEVSLTRDCDLRRPCSECIPRGLVYECDSPEAPDSGNYDPIGPTGQWNSQGQEMTPEYRDHQGTTDTHSAPSMYPPPSHGGWSPGRATQQTNIPQQEVQNAGETWHNNNTLNEVPGPAPIIGGHVDEEMDDVFGEDFGDLGEEFYGTLDSMIGGSAAGPSASAPAPAPAANLVPPAILTPPVAAPGGHIPPPPGGYSQLQVPQASWALHPWLGQGFFNPEAALGLIPGISLGGPTGVGPMAFKCDEILTEYVKEDVPWNGEGKGKGKAKTIERKVNTKCNKQPARRCEFGFADQSHVDNTHGHTPHHVCDSCEVYAQGQGTFAHKMQAQMKIKHWTCQGCAQALTTAGSYNINVCQCMKKLAESWVCEEHAIKGYLNIALMATQVTNWLDSGADFGAGTPLSQLCPECIVNPTDPTSRVYACKSCSFYVRKP